MLQHREMGGILAYGLAAACGARYCGHYCLPAALRKAAPSEIQSSAGHAVRMCCCRDVVSYPEHGNLSRPQRREA